MFTAGYFYLVETGQPQIPRLTLTLTFCLINTLQLLMERKVGFCMYAFKLQGHRITKNKNIYRLQIPADGWH